MTSTTTQIARLCSRARTLVEHLSMEACPLDLMLKPLTLTLAEWKVNLDDGLGTAQTIAQDS